MPIPSITREAAEDLISAVEDIMGEGFQYPGLSGDPSNPGAVYIYAKRESVSAMTIRSRLKRAKELYGVEPRQEAYRPARAAPCQSAKPISTLPDASPMRRARSESRSPPDLPPRKTPDRGYPARWPGPGPE